MEGLENRIRTRNRTTIIGSSWLFVVNPNRIELFAAINRNIGAIDPYLREMYEGLGCALEKSSTGCGSKRICV
jgi:hypothetical protein